VIKESDMHEPATYYGQSPASGFWILEYGDTFIGFIALDAKDAKRTRKGVIRHFYVEEAYRKTGIQEDLLAHALKNAFDKSSAVEYIEAADSPSLTPYIHDCYQRVGFRLQGYQSVGIWGLWRYYTTVLLKEEWKQ
jgi:GNAT superfamily N-acetyltransferase